MRPGNRSNRFTFNKSYFGLALLLFTVEILIALFIRDKFIRPYIGDVLVVMLIYCSARSVFSLHVFTTAFGVLIFSFVIEFLQYVHLVERLGLAGSRIARTVIGTSFAWMDLIAYASGIFIVIAVEYFIDCKTSINKPL